MPATGWRSSAVVAALCLLAACGARRPVLPTGSGAPFPGFEAAHDEATRECRAVDSLTASLGLSGRSGPTRLRGRIDAGLEAPARVRLEGFPPVIYGSRPFFVLVATGDEATLVLPRDERVLLGARPAEIVEALAGVPLGPADLRALLAGCGLAPAQLGEARRFERGWAAIDQGEATIFIRQIDGRWRVAAAARDTMTIHYDDYVAGRPQSIRIRTEPARREAATDLTLRLSDVEWNVPLGDRVFVVDVPARAFPLTLEELRMSGPLRGEDHR
ncbi:hypothetical protein BH23ACI1_BH23ACI1_06350 [soil metagenome]